MISFEETDTEFLVAIPADQLERAKRIRPRFWQVSRKRWVYPRKLHIYKALVAEIGKDADVVDFTHPDSIADSKRLWNKRSLSDLDRSSNTPA